MTAAKTQTVRLPGEEVAAGLVAELAQGVIALDDRIKTTTLTSRADFAAIHSPR